jgi:hypothetical protein
MRTTPEACEQQRQREAAPAALGKGVHDLEQAADDQHRADQDRADQRRGHQMAEHDQPA